MGGECGGASLLPFSLVANEQLFQEPKRLLWVILDGAEREGGCGVCDQRKRILWVFCIE